MSIKGNAEIIRDAVATDANTAARIGSNLVEIADDLIDKNALISANTLKVGYTDALVAAAPSVTTNGTNIATNTTNIATNAADISSNDADIATNVANIAANTSGVAANLTSLTTKVNTSSIGNDLTTGGTNVPLSAQQGVDLKTLIDSGGVVPINNLTSTSTVVALAANQGRVLKGLVDGNSANVSFNSSDIATNTANITSNDTDIATNVTNIASNATNIASNDTDIATNVTNITTNASNIASNDTDIATNVTNIATNATNIASNDTDIAANTTNITANDTDIATNVTNIATNVTNIAANSTAIAAIGGAFTGGVWNGYTYQLVTSPATGKVWLDRNIGATQVATSVSDSNSYGFLFQFGRSADNHQFRNSATTTTLEVSHTNTTSNFVLNSNNWSNNMSSYVWQSDWEGKVMNDVCPPGFRLPTLAEISAEISGFSTGNMSGAFSSFLKMPANEQRDNNSGNITNYTYAYLWLANQSYIYFSASGAFNASGPINVGHGVRCIKI